MPLSNPYRDVPAILQLAAAVADESRFLFDMGSSAVASCHTPGCIAGTAAAIWPELPRKTHGASTQPHFDGSSSSVEKLAAKLNVNLETIDILCYPEECNYRNASFIADYPNYDEISRSRAVTELHRLAFEGEVTWDSAPTPFTLHSQLPPVPHEVPVYLLISPEGFFWLANGDPVGPFPTAELAALDCEA